MKHFRKITNIESATLEHFTQLTDIVVEEKLDGANASISIKDGVIECFSRVNQLDKTNNLRGFYNWATTQQQLSIISEDFVLFGEWLVKHIVPYPEDKLSKFYLFDIWDKSQGKYLDYKNVKAIADLFKLDMVPILYEGKFQGIEHLESFVGTTKLGGEYGEGIVIKYFDGQESENIYGDDGRFKIPAYVKILNNQFEESKSKPRRKYDPTQERMMELEKYIVGTIVTDIRIEKTLLKLIDLGELPSYIKFEDLNKVGKALPYAIINDCVAEEPEVVKMIGKLFNRYTSHIVMLYVKNRIKEQYKKQKQIASSEQLTSNAIHLANMVAQDSAHYVCELEANLLDECLKIHDQVVGSKKLNTLVSRNKYLQMETNAMIDFLMSI